MTSMEGGRPDAVIGTLDGIQPAPTGVAPIDSPQRRCQIWFDGPDDAYLVAAAIHRYLQADIVPDLILIPPVADPPWEVPMSATSLRPVRSLVRRFGGHVEGPPPPVAGMTAMSDSVAVRDQHA